PAPSADERGRSSASGPGRVYAHVSASRRACACGVPTVPDGRARGIRPTTGGVAPTPGDATAGPADSSPVARACAHGRSWGHDPDAGTSAARDTPDLGPR